MKNEGIKWIGKIMKQMILMMNIYHVRHLYGGPEGQTPECFRKHNSILENTLTFQIMEKMGIVVFVKCRCVFF